MTPLLFAAALTLAVPAPAPAPGALDLSRAVLPYRAPEALPAGLAHTSLDLGFGPKSVSSQVGFLCGREPGHGETGAASAFGYDPHGRFLGAKLSRAF